MSARAEIGLHVEDAVKFYRDQAEDSVRMAVLIEDAWKTRGYSALERVHVISKRDAQALELEDWAESREGRHAILPRAPGSKRMSGNKRRPRTSRRRK